MANAKQQGCEAQRIEVAGLNLGILDLEKRVAYLLDLDTVMERVKPSGIWKALDTTSLYVLAYIKGLIENLSKQGFSINYYKPWPVKETRRVYDILS